MPRSQRPRQGMRPLYILPQPNDVPVTTLLGMALGASDLFPGASGDSRWPGGGTAETVRRAYTPIPTAH